MDKFIKKLKENWLNYTILFLLVVMIFGSSVGNVSSSLSSKSLSMDRAGGYYANEMYYDSGFVPEAQDRKITKNGNLNLESDKYNLAKENILRVSDIYNVILLKNNEYVNNDNYKRLTLSGKIDSNKLESYLNEIKSFGKVEFFNVYSNDVTESYTNYDERISRYSNQLVKYENMLSDKISVEDEIKIHKRIDNIEDNLFYLKKNFQNLDNRIVYSQVDISLSEEISVLDQVDFINLEEGFKGFVESLGAALWLVIYVLGFVLPFVLVYGVYKLIRKIFFK
jgi:hypothetical protein